MLRNEGATPGAILSATPGATPSQRPDNGGATYTPYTLSVAPALGGGVRAAKDENEIEKRFSMRDANAVDCARSGANAGGGREGNLTEGRGLPFSLPKNSGGVR